MIFHKKIFTFTSSIVTNFGVLRAYHNVQRFIALRICSRNPFPNDCISAVFSKRECQSQFKIISMEVIGKVSVVIILRIHPSHGNQMHEELCFHSSFHFCVISLVLCYAICKALDKVIDNFL